MYCLKVFSPLLQSFKKPNIKGVFRCLLILPFFFSILGGIIACFRIYRTQPLNYSTNTLDLSNYINHNFSPTEIFLISPHENFHPVSVLTGRQVYVSHPKILWLYGYNSTHRIQNLNIYTKGERIFDIMYNKHIAFLVESINSPLVFNQSNQQHYFNSIYQNKEWSIKRLR